MLHNIGKTQTPFTYSVRYHRVNTVIEVIACVGGCNATKLQPANLQIKILFDGVRRLGKSQKSTTTVSDFHTKFENNYHLNRSRAITIHHHIAAAAAATTTVAVISAQSWERYLDTEGGN